MHVFGCKAYALRTKFSRGDKLTERTLVGYLVGYDSTNIYRIWVPSINAVIRSRDVTFRDDRFFTAEDVEKLAKEDIIQLITFPEPVEEESTDDELLPYTETAYVSED